MRTYKSKAIQISSIPMENPQFTMADLTSTIPMSKFYDVLFELAFVPTPCMGATCGVEIKMYLLITHIFASKQLSDQFDCHCHYKNILSLLQEKGYEAEFVPNQSMEALPKPHYFSANLTRKGEMKVVPSEIDMHKLLPILAQNNVSLSLLYTHRACAAMISKSCYPIAQSVSSILGSNWGTTPINKSATYDNVQRSAHVINLMYNATKVRQFTMSPKLTLYLPFGTDLPLKVRHMPRAPKFLPAENLTAEGTLAIGKVGKLNFYLSKENIAHHTMLLGMSGMGKTVLLNNMMHELYKHNIHFVNIDLSTQAFRRVAPATKSMVYTVDANVSPMDFNLFNVEGMDPKRTKGMASTLLKNLLEEDFKAIHQFVDDAFDTFQGTSVLEFIKHALTTYDQNDYYQGELRSMRGSLEVRLNELKKLNNGYMFHLEKILKENTIIEFANVDEEKTRALYIYFILLNIWLQKKYSYNQSGIARPTVLFIDEVHRLLDTDNCKYAAMALKQLLKDILAEGRKFGLWLVLADQTFDIVSHFYYHSGTKVIFKSPYHDGMNDYFHTVKTYIPALEKGKALIYTSKMEAPAPVELDAPHPEFTINMNDKEDLLKHIYMNFKSIYDDQYRSSRAKKLLNDFRDMRKIYSALSFNRFVDGVKIPPSIEEEMKRLISQDPDLKNVCINT